MAQWKWWKILFFIKFPMKNLLFVLECTQSLDLIFNLQKVFQDYLRTISVIGLLVWPNENILFLFRINFVLLYFVFGYLTASYSVIILFTIVFYLIDVRCIITFYSGCCSMGSRRMGSIGYWDQIYPD
jgi:hypothetical protein